MFLVTSNPCHRAAAGKTFPDCRADGANPTADSESKRDNGREREEKEERSG